MISGLVLKYLKEAGLVIPKRYAYPLPRSSKVLLTRPLVVYDDARAATLPERLVRLIQQVEAISVHYFGPCRYEVAYEFLGVVVLRINLGVRTKYRV